MSLNQRRLLFYSFLFLFILVAPFAILYATGRTINWQQLEIHKTGSMVVESVPNNADIFLNNKRPSLFLQRLFGRVVIPRTSAKLTNLLPGSYVVRLELPGYVAWEEKVKVQPNEVTHIGPIYLFKHAEPTLVTSLEQNAWWNTSPDHSIIFKVNGNEITFINLKDGGTTANLTLTAVINKNIQWSNNNSLIINDRYVINSQGELILDLTNIPNYNPTFLRWSNEQPDSLYFVDKEILYKLTISTKQIISQLNLKPLLAGRQLLDYKPSDRQFYGIFKTKQNAELIITTFGSPDHQETITLPSGSYHFLANESKKNLLLEKNKHHLYLIEQPLTLFLAPRITAVANEYTNGRWTNNTLLYSTPLEIRQWSNGQEKLIGRFGEAIIDTTLLPERGAILIITNKAITVRSQPDHLFAQTTTLTSDQAIETLLLTNPDNLYYIATYNQQRGIFRLDY